MQPEHRERVGVPAFDQRGDVRVGEHPR
jgi:hypothetical protein